MAVRGIRGATTASGNSAEEILEATEELLEALVEANRLQVEEVASAVFTTTPDLTAEYPAAAARRLGWQDVALLGAVEMAKPGGVERCIRVLLQVNTERPQKDMRHVYLRGAAVLRPDRQWEREGERA
ncbi:MAG TPA: chorismate mutase [Firmicutes bacterium]|nr:chorismate mutase [Bacillota bacterium]